MPERTTAEQKLERILYVLPCAARGEGASIAELAASLGIEREQLLRELEEVTAREFYHPAGSGDQIQVGIERDRLRVWTTGELKRPVKLGPREALALGLGLRTLAAEAADERRAELLDLARRLEAELASRAPEALLESLAIDAPDASAGEVRSRLVAASRECKRCTIDYLKPNASEPEERAVLPFVLVYASQRWYLLAHCCREGEVRAFRVDRIVGLRVTDERFDAPADFDADAYLRDGYVYRADAETEAVVRYSARIARWIREFGPVEERADGTVVLRHRVADPGWIVRHVLQFGRDAVVEEPAELRALVAESARRFLD